MDDDRDWICHEQDQSQSASPSKLNIQFAGSTTLPYWEGHNSFIWSEFEVYEHLMESLFHKLSNGSGYLKIMSAMPPNHYHKLMLFLPKVVLSLWA